ncbi:curli-like amyloid fiber formation chaperone CsgH [Methyloligella solikamskensis]|uniref:Curli-like amyloid fiber formation chaperone CsgH n=1 Tax=Methyloligella solikamskensis TaxID=1177756 RepID=A0ABW3J9G8_9HYPH
MIRILAPLSVALIPLSMVWAASGSAAPAGAPTMELPLQKPAMPVGYAPSHSCEIRVNESWGTVNLEGFAYADHHANGSYELKVRQGSGSQIIQGGEFSAYPGGSEPLSTVAIGGSGDYSAVLTVRWADGSEPCTKSIGTGGWLPSFL